MDIKEQNDWQEFRKHLQEDINKGATSNKTLIWTAIGAEGLFTFCAMVVAVIALVFGILTDNKINNMQKEIAELKMQRHELQEIVKEADRAYERTKKMYQRKGIVD